MADDKNIFDTMIEMGMGMTLANQIPRMMNAAMPNQGGMETPPPIASSGIQIYAAINGGQAGPFNEQELITLIQKGHINQSTMIWKQGLANWIPANQIPEVGKLLLLYSIE